MSFTNVETVRKHLLGAVIEAKDVFALSITLNGEEDCLLPDRNISSNSEVVKWKYTVHPSVDGPIELISNKVIQLEDCHLVPGTVVVTLNDGLETVYFEDVDYRIDYIEGTIARFEHGSIPDHQLVYVYYEKFELFENDTDYTIDYGNGIIKRTQNSDIPDGATVLIDYSVEKGGIEDTAIDQVMIEVEDIILRSLAPEYNSSSTDQGIKTAETMLVLSIVASTFAAATLMSERSSDAYNRAREWQRLSELWERQAWTVLGPFLNPSALRSPVTQS